ncbi:AraC family transcriptional regulator [Vibrio sp. T187]|uniref:helix-turn-helix transcriptional regulator n=1 Tax=Vibrio TaxID=662 RepID=UPI0010C9EE2D|nr:MULTISPECIES: AraC family transcriptional regulator [Vibrio]MBW3694240.1 AraC family transcriptional regulator [Vibrio sp. T187]
MDMPHIGHWLGRPISDLPSITSDILRSHFHIVEHGEDISILSDFDIHFCFFYLTPEINNQLLHSALNICNNLGKHLILLYEGELERSISLNHAIYDKQDIYKEDFERWVNMVASKIHLSFSSNKEYLERKASEPLIMKSNISQDFIETLRYIENHLSENIREEDIASRCHYSVTYFSKVFHRIIGISFRDYVCNKRINLAKKILLRDRGTKVSVVAYQCGYQDVSYFSRIFKKKTGMTPGMFRQIH